MEWRKWYMDLTLVPLGLLALAGYHVWLWHKVRTQPLSTIIGINTRGRRSWVSAMIKDNEKKNILAVQTLRNTIMGSTLMATTAILLCTGLAAVISSTYSVKKPLEDAVYGAHGELVLALKYVTLLTLFLFSFVCHSLSIGYFNHVGININVILLSPSNPEAQPQYGCENEASPADTLTPEYVTELLEKGFALNTIGNRLFYAALPLLLWIFGPVLVFLCSLSLIPILYNLDFVLVRTNAKANKSTKHNATTTSSSSCSTCTISSDFV